MSDHFFQVAVNAPISTPLTYSASSILAQGTRVQVPLSSRSVSGVVLGPCEKPSYKTKDINSVEEEFAPLPDGYIRWASWVSKYYQFPIGSTLHTSFPPLKKNSNRKGRKTAVVPDLEIENDPTLTDHQQTVFDAVPLGAFSTHLIHGITGSGKTEIYIQLLRKVLERGQNGLVLVPEIALTPQLVERFARRFGSEISVLHSQLTPRERTNQWWSVVDGKARILIGARSALFCPIPNLGLIVVDEEHESSYKQDEKLRYNGRDAAVVRAQIENVPILLGSATPSLESYHNSLAQKYTYHHIPSRALEQNLPDVHVVDMRKQKDRESDSPIPFWMSQELYDKLTEYLESGQQVACFLNRRGMAHVVMCTNCGAQKNCPNCDINLTLHNNVHLVCHYCGYAEKYRDGCETCGDGYLEPMGLGTERLEEDLAQLFPEKKIQRVDRDEISGREQLERVIQDMQEGRVDILVGTQMISKGLDFPRLNFVAIVLADIAFNMPDFRATERAFQLLTQVAGRSGRHTKGEVLVQTYNPSHPAIRFGRDHDFLSFASEELEARRELKYPPYHKLAVLRSLSINKTLSYKTIMEAAHRAREVQRRFESLSQVEILGPAECPLLKVRNQYRHMLLFKGPDAQSLNALIEKVLSDQKWVSPKSRLILDVDPINMM